jgi:hypothetical protein
MLTHRDGYHTGGLIDTEGNAIYPQASYTLIPETIEVWFGLDFDSLDEETVQFHRRLHSAIGGGIITLA